jgi:glycosyltransferase involved in cell wall biosynthesis
MATKAPRVSIGLPVFNGEKYLPEALDSLVSQDFEDFELILSDNASIDSTEAICREFAEKDRRIRYYRNETNIGASKNYNLVLELARGEYFKWASHDDICHPAMVRRCLERFQEAAPSVVLVYPKADIIDEFGKFKEPSLDHIDSPSRWPYLRVARVIWHIRFANALWGLTKTEVLRRTRLMGVIEADLVLLVELALQGQFIEIPEVLYWQRRHAGCAIPSNPSAEALLAWHDPERAKDRIILPHWERVYIQYLKGVSHANLNVLDKLLCYGSIPLVGYWQRFLRWTGPFRHRHGLYRKKRRNSIVAGQPKTS